MTDRTKLTFDSRTSTFRNNNLYTGSFVISGTTSPGINQRTTSVSIPSNAVLVDALFRGPAPDNPSNRDSDDQWFRDGLVLVPATGADTVWRIDYRRTSTGITITASYAKTFEGTSTLTATTVFYRFVDYVVV